MTKTASVWPIVSSRLWSALSSPLFALSSSDPERAHDVVIRSLARVSTSPALLRMTQRAATSFFGGPTPTASAGPGFRAMAAGRKVFGLTFPNPVGLASGFDKNGSALPALAALGFGFLEAGTVTRFGQPGNPRPRIARWEERQSVVNWMGFPNVGADAVARTQARRSSPVSVPVGWNISKSRVTPLNDAVDDYLYTLRRLHGYGDYFVINVSSPNTPGLREMQGSSLLADLLQACRAEARELARDRAEPKPILLKISPDLTDRRLDEIVEMCIANDIAGIVATNTVPTRRVVDGGATIAGGMSGAPLASLALRTVRALHQRLEGRIPIVAVGGVSTAADAGRMLEAGASLIQVYTAFVYQGPKVVFDINRVVRDSWLRAGTSDRVGSSSDSDR